MDHPFATLILGLFVPVAIGLFFVMRPLTATLVVLLGSDMFLPVGVNFKLPFFPLLDRYNLPYLCVLFGCLLRCPGRVTKLPKDKWITLFALLALANGVATALANGDALSPILPGLDLKAGFYLSANEFFPRYLALYLGYALVRDAHDVERVLAGLAIAGLLYCPFAIVELRMSPQFHQWVYGYNTGKFDQTIRWGGYRPKVFMDHGLALAHFFIMTTLACFSLAKTRNTLFGFRTRLLAWFHLVVFILCKSTGAIVMVLGALPLIWFTKSKRQLMVAFLLALLTILYPLLRASDVFPVQGILNAAGSLGEDRRESLEYRFRNEDMLLSHARERIWLGWGFGRNHVFNDEGKDISVTDGYWIIMLGELGIVGFLASMVPLVWPILFARRHLGDHTDNRDTTHLATIALIIALLTVDLIPNAYGDVFQSFLVGMFARQLTELRVTTRNRSKGPP